jgi:phage baseplate assembly protein V
MRLETLERRLERFGARIALLVRRGLVKATGADFFLQVEASEDEMFDDVELWQSYGLASRPLGDAEVLMVKPGGQGDDAVAIAVNHRAHRPSDLEAGEVVIYGTKGTGQAQVRLKPDGTIVLIPATGKFVEVGAAGGEAQLKGETLKAALQNLATSLTSAAAWPAVNTAGTALTTALAGVLATKAKVT